MSPPPAPTTAISTGLSSTLQSLTPPIDLKLIVLASHLSPRVRSTPSDEIEADGFPIAARLECLLSSDTDIGMAKTIGVAILSLADTLAVMRPDLLLLIADRYEMLAPAAVALALRIPIAHIEGGERSQGAIDDAVRNALTKMSHIHFTATVAARNRVIRHGRSSPCASTTPAHPPSTTSAKAQLLSTPANSKQRLNLDLSLPTAVIAYHPVTLPLRHRPNKAGALIAALVQLPQQLVFCFPNADAGSYALVQRTEDLLRRRGHGHLFVNLPAVVYWSLLREAQLFLGNSSSGIMETASFALPTVNIGLRQKGRERPPNVLDAPAETQQILATIHHSLSQEFAHSLAGMENPYGDGHAADRIVHVLTTLPSRDQLLLKQNLA